MRVHITMDDALLAELDRRVHRRRRSTFIAEAVRRALEDERRWELIEASIGAVSEAGHEWEDDPAAWVRRQRQLDDRRVG